jgi:hypothetical protein
MFDVEHAFHPTLTAISSFPFKRQEKIALDGSLVTRFGAAFSVGICPIFPAWGNGSRSLCLGKIIGGDSSLQASELLWQKRPGPLELEQS